MILAISLGRGVQIIVGHRVGAGDKQQAYREVFVNLARSMLITLVGVSLLVLIRVPLLELFTQDRTREASFCLALAKPGMGEQIACQNRSADYGRLIFSFFG